MKKEYLTISEAVEHTGKSESTIRRLIRSEGDNLGFKEVFSNGQEKWQLRSDALTKYFDSAYSSVTEPLTTHRHTDEHPVEQGVSDGYLDVLLKEKDSRIQSLEKEVEAKRVEVADLIQSNTNLIQSNTNMNLLIESTNQKLVSALEGPKQETVPVLSEKKDYGWVFYLGMTLLIVVSIAVAIVLIYGYLTENRITYS